MTSKYWEITMILLILTNTIVFSMFDYLDREEKSTRNKVLYGLNVVLTAVYLLEAVCKIISLGIVVHPNSYLRNGWHIYDLFIIIVGVLYCFPYLRRNRIVHVLCIPRILKLAYTSTAMNNLMTPTMLSLKQMGDVAALVFFLLILFSIIGHYLFKGIYYYRCRLTPEPINKIWEVDRDIIRLCNAYGAGDYTCPVDRFCGSPDMHDIHLHDENIETMIEVNYGTLNYDNVYVAFLSSIQVITLDNWGDLMYKGQDSNGSIFARIYFPLLSFVGAYFCLNLIVAVVFDTFQHFKELIQRNKDKKAEENSEPAEEAHQAIQDLIDKKPQLEIIMEEKPGQSSVMHEGANYIDNDSVRQSIISTKSVKKENAGSKFQDKEKKEDIITAWCRTMLKHWLYKPVIIFLILGNFAVQALNRHNISDYENSLIDTFDTVFFCLFCIEMIIGIKAKGQNYFKEASTIMDFIINLLGLIEIILTYSCDKDGSHYC